MKVAVTGATGFLGHYIARHLRHEGHTLRCWYRPTSNRNGIGTEGEVEWVRGELGDAEKASALVEGADALVHAALWRPGGGTFQGDQGDLVEFAQRNVIGSLQLFEAARRARVRRVVFVSTCAVHDVILNDRPLDEAHPLWPQSHYGAHKAAIEKFIHSYGLGDDWPICAIRPTGIYGVANPPQQSKWYELVKKIVRGKPVRVAGGGKEVHASDVARAIELLLRADAKAIAGQAFACYDQYISERHVAEIAERAAGTHAEIEGESGAPKHQIDTSKIRHLGMTFGGEDLLVETVKRLVREAKQA